MSWTKLLASKTVTPLQATKAELDKLRSLVARSLKDVAATGLSTDMRFILAYDAALCRDCAWTSLICGLASAPCD